MSEMMQTNEVAAFRQNAGLWRFARVLAKRGYRTSQVEVDGPKVASAC